MRWLPSSATLIVALIALLGCDTSPTAPSGAASSLAALAGPYVLTIEVDDRCSDIPASLRTRIYDVDLRTTPYQYLSVDTVDDALGYLGGDLWGTSAGSLYRFEWNDVDIGGGDYPDPTGSRPLYICGDGAPTQVSGRTISGVLLGKAFLEGGPSCLGASHRFVLRPR